MPHETLTLSTFYLGCDLEVWWDREAYYWYNRTYDTPDDEGHGTAEDAMAAAKKYLRELP